MTKDAYKHRKVTQSTFEFIFTVLDKCSNPNTIEQCLITLTEIGGIF